MNLVLARDVPVLEGRFDFADYVDHVREMLRQATVNGYRLPLAEVTL